MLEVIRPMPQRADQKSEVSSARAPRKGSRSEPTVPLRPVVVLARELAREGTDATPLLRQMGIDLSVPFVRYRRIPLSRMMELGRRAVELLGGGVVGTQRLERTAVSAFERNRLAALLGNVASARALYAAGYLIFLRPCWRSVVRSGQFLKNGQFKLTIELPGGADAILAVIRGMLRGLPCTTGGAEARVEVSRSGWATLLYVTLPPSRSIWVRFGAWRRSLFGSRAMMEQLLSQQEQLGVSYEELQAANEQLQRQSDELRAIQARNEAVVENTAEFILVCDENGRSTFANQSARRLFAELTARRRPLSVFRFVHPDDAERAQRVFLASARSDRPQRSEFRLVDPATQSVIWLEASAQRFQAARGALRILITARDIGDRKRAEQRRQQDADRLEIEVRRRTYELQRTNEKLRELHTRLINAERMGAAQELAGSVAHAINNPLAALAGTVEMMIETDPDPDPKLLRILQLARRIRSVVGRTLQLSREGTLNFALEDPGTILREVHDEILERCRTRGVELELDVPATLPHAYADRTLLRAALVAVAENAVDASPRGGRVKLEVASVEGLKLVEFRITDSGPGVPRAIRERVFEPFFSTKAAGTGLGLAIARGIIMGHEGRITFTDAPGGGALATVEIPLQIAAGYRSAEPGIALES